MKIRTSVGLLFAGLLVAPIALAAGFGVGSPDKTTDVSGNSGTNMKLGPKGSTSADDVLTSIEWGEVADNPCRIVVGGVKMSASGKETTWSDQHLYDSCKIGGDGKKVSLQPASDNSVRAIRAIRVCTTDKSESSYNRLKGIEIWAAKITKKGEVVNDDATEKAFHANCKEWQKKVECPENEVAVGLVATHDDKRFRGLALECAKVIAK